MKHADFWMRAGSLVIAAAALAAYQVQALDWQRQTEENREAVAQAQQHNAGTAGTAMQYTDGTYTGSGVGFGGTISVEVTVEDSKLSDIAITSADGEDAAYLDKAKQIVENILQEQTTQVDTVSGATFSSSGIRDAVQQALEGEVSE